MDWCLGLDTGHSATKMIGARVRAPTQRVQQCFESVAVLASAHSQGETDDEAASIDLVSHKRKTYLVGSSAMAIAQPSSFADLKRDWIYEPSHDLLVLSALKRFLLAGLSPSEAVLLVVGLPASHFSANRASYREHVLELARTAGLKCVEVVVQRQPAGILESVSFTARGGLDRTVDLESGCWAVIDIGELTTDFYVMNQTRYLPMASGSVQGFKRAKDFLASELAGQGLPHHHAALESSFREHVVVIGRRRIDVKAQARRALSYFSDDIRNESVRRLEDLRHELSGILLGGGAAELVYQTIRREFAGCVHGVKVVSEPRYAIAEGFFRFALAMAKAMEKSAREE
jgi:plasmid segregation protein ParM